MNYWVQRIAMAVLLLLAVSMLTFGAMSLLGDPLFNILGPRAGDTSPEGIALIDDDDASQRQPGDQHEEMQIESAKSLAFPGE